MHLNQFSCQKHTHTHVLVILPQLPELSHSLMRIIPIEAYMYYRHLSFPCCFHCHYSFLYSFSWQPFSLLLSLDHHFEMQVDHSMIPLPTSILALIKVVALLIIQSKLL
jgi:hypothetical protein